VHAVLTKSINPKSIYEKTLQELEFVIGNDADAGFSGWHKSEL
jgi:nicotinic acid mononucleotide adenylyltransferase